MLLGLCQKVPGVKDRSASYLLRIKSMVWSGQGPSLFDSLWSIVFVVAEQVLLNKVFMKMTSSINQVSGNDNAMIRPRVFSSSFSSPNLCEGVVNMNQKN